MKNWYIGFLSSGEKNPEEIVDIVHIQKKPAISLKKVKSP
jgi:hypothetical protein